MTSNLNDQLSFKKPAPRAPKKKDTITYCKYQIEKVRNSQLTRIKKAAAIKKIEQRMAAIRTQRGAGKSENSTIAELKIKLAIAQDEIKELRALVSLASAADSNSYESFIDVAKTLGCTVTGAKGIYQHRASLPAPFNTWSREKLQNLVMQLIKFKRLKKIHAQRENRENQTGKP